MTSVTYFTGINLFIGVYGYALCVSVFLCVCWCVCAHFRVNVYFVCCVYGLPKYFIVFVTFVLVLY